MEHFFTGVYEDFIGRGEGSVMLRAIVLPLIACVFATRVGLHDARKYEFPFFPGLPFYPDHRHDLLRRGCKRIGTVIAIGLILDVLYQVVVFHAVHPAEAVVVAVLLVVIPYLFVCASVTRVIGWKNGRFD